MFSRAIKTFSMPACIGDGRLDLLLKLINQAHALRESKTEFRLDWNKTKCILPAGYAVLTCLVDSLIDCRIAVKSFGVAKSMRSSPVLSRLLRIEAGASPVHPQVFSMDEPNVLLRGNLAALDVTLMERIEEKFNALVPEETLFAGKLIVNELIQNTVDHSTAERYYVYAGCVEKEFHIGVLDMGITIPAKLEQKYAAADDLAYLELALKKGIGTRSLRPGGLGLSYFFEFLKQNEGRLTILSRGAQIRRYFKTRQSQKNILRHPLCGTWCFARLPLEKKR